eukprot:TRINITY_DN6574_c0_g1_i1.p1 TRINITY_DN6574_c0_g1~~TRINITY_DN6574_c0_g1_i1.p1  ORF type:complete len:203 (+),score=61.36 TRINITY_DN6574_c0_g1_i1:204-812(+)
MDEYSSYEDTPPVYDQAPPTFDDDFRGSQGGGGFPDDFGQEEEAGVKLPPPSAMPTEESILLREWRRKRGLELEEKARISREQHQKILEQAEYEKEIFYNQRQKQVAGAKTNNREKEKVFMAHLEALNAKSGGNYWESVVAFVNFDVVPDRKDKKSGKGANISPRPSTADVKPGKQTDMSRMRQVLLKLKHNPPIREAPIRA